MLVKASLLIVKMALLSRGGILDGLNVLTRLVETNLYRDILSRYVKRVPGHNLTEIETWLLELGQKLAAQDADLIVDDFNELEIAAALELRYENLPESVKAKVRKIEAKARSEAEKLRVKDASQKVPTATRRAEEHKEGFQVALKVLEGPGKSLISGKIRETGTLFSDADLDSLVKGLFPLGQQLFSSQKITQKQLSRLEAVASLGFHNWPAKYREYLKKLIAEIFLRIKEEAREAEYLRRRVRSLENKSARDALNEAFEAAKKAKAEAERKAQEQAEAERVAALELQLAQEAERLLALEKLEQKVAREKKLLADQLKNNFQDFVAKNLLGSQTNPECREVISEYIQDWASANLGIHSLDSEQALAIASNFRNTQVVARAGSGKTTALAVRLCFLILELKVPPTEILALTFNKDAQESLELRVQRLLIYKNELARNGVESARSLSSAISASATETKKAAESRGIRLPLVLTFHGLANRINVAKLGKDAPRQIEGKNGSAAEVLDGVVRNLLQTQVGESLLREMLGQYFSDDLDRLEERALSAAELLEIRKHLPYESLRGEIVKSIGERKVANWLFTNGLTYMYERAFYADERYLYPDFTVLSEGKVLGVIEYTGLIGEFDYDNDLSKKRDAYKRNSIHVLELRPGDVVDEQILNRKLSAFAGALGLPKPEPLSKDQIWAAVRQRLVGELRGSRFNNSLNQFIMRAFREKLTPEYIRAEALTRLKNDPVGRTFALIAADIQGAYSEKLSSNKEIDQTQALNLAIKLLKQSHCHINFDGEQVEISRLRFISVDEHQDSSPQFEEMVELLHASSKSQIFAVGDDWQCINRFAGAEPKIFSQFQAKRAGSIRLTMPNNYRSRPEIVEAGNETMRISGGAPGRSTRIPGGMVSLYSVEKIQPRERESGTVKDVTGRAIRRLVVEELSRHSDTEITILCRTATPSWHSMGRGFQGQKAFENMVDALIPGLGPELRRRVRAKTVHSFKGLQSDVVIVPDVQSRSFPLIHGDQRFQSFFGDDLRDLIEDERRLLYVAMTRAKERLHLLTRAGLESPFLTKLHRSKERDLNQLSSGFVLRVSSDKAPDERVRALLDSEGFSCSSRNRSSNFVAERDVTALALNQGGPEKALEHLYNKHESWLEHSMNLGARIEVIADKVSRNGR